MAGKNKNLKGKALTDAVIESWDGIQAMAAFPVVKQLART